VTFPPSFKGEVAGLKRAAFQIKIGRKKKSNPILPKKSPPLKEGPGAKGIPESPLEGGPSFLLGSEKAFLGRGYSGRYFLRGEGRTIRPKEGENLLWILGSFSFREKKIYRERKRGVSAGEGGPPLRTEHRFRRKVSHRRKILP